MADIILNFFSSFPPALATLFISMLPIVERFAVPVAIVGYHLPVWEVLLLVISGNMVPIIIILTFAGKFHDWVSKNSHHFFAKAWIKTLAHAQKKFARYEKYELIGLMIFMSIPLPINGGFTGALIAFILGLRLGKAWPYLFGGVVIAACITVGIIAGLDKIFF
ncbi:MAG TPA: small multi-drug export protein [Candidatus Udaeobacter sp.]|nr:small multi-drug export protein [Candidatus Udaeobacter sp.]